MSRKGGPTPIPTKLKILHGTREARINRNEPDPPQSDRPPTAPTWMSDDAKKVWRALAKDMHAKGLLTTWDRETFAVFCEAVVHHRRACELVDASAVLVRGEKGGLVKNPALQAVRDTAATVRAFALEFGLTPSSRSGIELPAAADFEDARRLLS